MRQEKTFLLDESSNVLSAARSIRDMLRVRARVYNVEKGAPLLWDPHTGAEVDIVQARNKCTKKLKLAGLQSLSLKGQYLRIVGTTSYANSGTDGCATAGFMRLWASASKWWYMHAFQESVERGQS